MSESAANPLEAILRHCAKAAPEPWYPSIYVKETGTPRDSLDPHLERLRLGGLIHLTDWMAGKGQGYALTPEGEELLKSPRQLARLQDGQLPTRSQPREEIQEELELPGESMRQALMGASTRQMTNLLIYLNVAVFVAGLVIAFRDGEVNKYVYESTPKALHLTGSLRGVDVYVDGQWWRLLTCCFVHIGFMHLLCNMISLHVLGPPVEQMLGSTRFLLLYLLSGVVGSCGALLENPAGAAGASGAIWGLMAALLALIVAHRQVLPFPMYQQYQRQLVSMLVLNLLFTFSMPRVSIGGHLGGGIAGLMLAVPIDHLRVGRGGQRVLALLMIVAVPVIALGMVYRSFAQPSGLLEAHARQVEQTRFENHFLASVEEVAHKSIGEYDKLHQLIQKRLGQNAQRRDPGAVEPALKELQAQREALEQVIGSLTNHEPFKNDAVEKQRRTAIDLLQALEKLLEIAADCLRADSDCSRLAEQEEKVKELMERWQRMPWVFAR